MNLAELHETVKKQLAPFELELRDGTRVEMVSVMKLDSASRKTVQAALKALADTDGEDDSPEALDKLYELLSKIISAVTNKPAKLLADLHDDDTVLKIALMTKVVEAWIGETQSGEASRSQS